MQYKSVFVKKSSAHYHVFTIQFCTIATIACNILLISIINFVYFYTVFLPI